VKVRDAAERIALHVFETAGGARVTGDFVKRHVDALLAHPTECECGLCDTLVHTRFGLNHSRPPDVSRPGSKHAAGCDFAGRSVVRVTSTDPSPSPPPLEGRLVAMMRRCGRRGVRCRNLRQVTSTGRGAAEASSG
jgi:hypothetical protein